MHRRRPLLAFTAAVAVCALILGWSAAGHAHGELADGVTTTAAGLVGSGLVAVLFLAPHLARSPWGWKRDLARVLTVTATLVAVTESWWVLRLAADIVPERGMTTVLGAVSATGVIVAVAALVLPRAWRTTTGGDRRAMAVITLVGGLLVVSPWGRALVPVVLAVQVVAFYAVLTEGVGRERVKRAAAVSAGAFTGVAALVLVAFGRVFPPRLVLGGSEFFVLLVPLVTLALFVIPTLIVTRGPAEA